MECSHPANKVELGQVHCDGWRLDFCTVCLRVREVHVPEADQVTALNESAATGTAG